MKNLVPLLFMVVVAVAHLVSANPWGNVDTADPIADARAAFSSGDHTWVAIQLQDRMDVPGVETAEPISVSDVRILNRFDGYKADHESEYQALQRLRGYALRYNLMLKKLQQQALEQQQYRY